MAFAENRADSAETHADIVLSGGTILTMDEANPKVEALLVRGNCIEAAGTLEDVIAISGRDAKAINLEGRTVIPGFADAHLHLNYLGQYHRDVTLNGMSKQEILDRLREHEKTLGPDEILAAYDWDFSNCPDPHRNDLDALFPDRPVFLVQFSGHGAWVNTKMLEMLGITESKSEFGLGKAYRDEQGRLNGLLNEPWHAPKAKRLFGKDERTPVQVRADMETAIATVTQHGITTVHDNTWRPHIVRAIAAAYDTGKLTVRISCWSRGSWRRRDWVMSRMRYVEGWYELGPRKYLLDGAFSSHSASLSEPYADMPDSRGSGDSVAEIVKYVRRGNREGRQIACHSIGDASTTAYIDAIAECGVPAGRRLRHRIEHAQLIRPQDIERIDDYGMVVSAQPHAAADPEKDAKLLGPERAARAYPFRSLLDAGVHLAFGSDFPGELTFDPLYGIHLAVNRDGGEAITALEAIACYTRGGAWAEFAEDRKGRLMKGFLADLVVLSDDPTGVPAETIRNVQVVATMVDGRFVYTSPDAPLEAVPVSVAAKSSSRSN